MQTHRLLDEEEREDTALRDRFKDKWSRQASSQLTETMRKEVEKFKGILDAATQADQKVKEKYESNRQAIILLGKPLEELNAAIPKAGAQASSLSASQVGVLCSQFQWLIDCAIVKLLQNKLLSCEEVKIFSLLPSPPSLPSPLSLPPSPSSLPFFSALLPQPVMELRSLMEEVKTIKVEREVIETTLRDPVADIGKRKGEGGRREGGKMREGRSIGTHTHTHAHTHPPTFLPHTAPKFLQALKDFGDVDEEAISEGHLLTEYGQLQQQVRECVNSHMASCGSL